MLKCSAICSTVLFVQSIGSKEGENMDAPLQDCTLEEQRGVVRFLWVVFSDVVRGDSPHHVAKHNPKKPHYATLFFDGAILQRGVHVFALLAANRLKAERCSADG